MIQTQVLTHEDDSLPLDPDSPFFLDHVTRYWWASQFADGKTVLDCACGSGYGSYILSKKAKSVTAVDLDPKSLKQAGETFSASNLAFQVFDILKLSELQRRFDLITAFEVIEHIPPHTTDLFLAQLAKALNPGGRLLLSTPNHDVVTKSGSFVPEFHINNFKPGELKGALKKHFSQVTMLGQFQKRSGIQGLVFDFDFFNLRHVLGKNVASLLSRRSDAAPTDSARQKKRNASEILSHFQTPPAGSSNYVFSAKHWRQAGLTVAICSDP